MAFVVDGEEWLFDGWSSEQVQDAIEDVLDRFDSAFARQEIVWIGDELQTKAVRGALDLWSLRDRDSPIKIPNEVWQELAASIGRAQRYLDEPIWPEGFDDYKIKIDAGIGAENPDVAWAHHNVRTGRAVACFGLSRKGVFLTESIKGSVPVHWVGDERSQSFFWRNAIDIEGNNPATLQRLAPHAYPGLYFQSDVWDGLDRFNGG